MQCILASGKGKALAIFKDEMFEAQWLRAAGHSSYGGAEFGECLEVARRIGTSDPERWFDAWSTMAARLHDAAERSELAGHVVSARGAYLRASNYWRAAWTFRFQPSLDEKARQAYRRHRDDFARAARLMTPAGEEVRIPYEGKFLHGYFFTAAADRAPRPTLIVNGGYDSTAEEAYFFSAAAAVERGYNAIVFDGPGQGAAIFEDGLVFRPDWEKVIGPVIDHLVVRPEVDPAQIALIGVSFGGYLAPRAASFEPRIAALIADPGQLSLIEEAKRRMPPYVINQLLNGRGIVARLLEMVLNHRLRDISRGWGLRRGLLVHGVATPLDYLRLMTSYAIEKPEAIRCPALICSAENDEIGATARTLFDHLTCPKTFTTFLAVEGAGGHCESGARARFNQVALDWLDGTLAAERTPAFERAA
jgi:pimeloyl-ACP methyl ester carboxylesterase